MAEYLQALFYRICSYINEGEPYALHISLLIIVVSIAYSCITPKYKKGQQIVKGTTQSVRDTAQKIRNKLPKINNRNKE